MDDILPPVLPGDFILVVAPAHTARQIMMDLAARLALAGRVDVVDGGNTFDAYRIARLIRRQTPELTAALQRIQLARAFTCYQMAAMLANMPLTHHPKLVLDFLCTFYDDSVALPESSRLLSESLRHIRRLSPLAPLVVSARPPREEQAERRPLFDRLRESSTSTLIFEQPPDQPPLRLF